MVSSPPPDPPRHPRPDPAPTPADRSVLVAGYAQLPQSTGAGVMWRHLTIIVRIDVTTGLVVDASTTLATRVADAFVAELLVGADLLRDQEHIVTTVERAYFGNGRKAIVGAIRDLAARLRESGALPPES